MTSEFGRRSPGMAKLNICGGSNNAEPCGLALKQD